MQNITSINLKVYVTAWLVCALTSNHLIAETTTEIKKEPWQLAAETEVWSPVPTTVTTSINGIPSDAIVLFDGKNLNQWQGAEGDAVRWKVKMVH